MRRKGMQQHDDDYKREYSPRIIGYCSNGPLYPRMEPVPPRGPAVSSIGDISAGRIREKPSDKQRED